MYSHNDDAIMYTSDSLGYIPLDEDPANYTQMMMNIDPFVTFVNPLNNTKHSLKIEYLEMIITLMEEKCCYTQIYFTLTINFKKHGKISTHFLPFSFTHLVSTTGVTRNKIFAHDDDVYGGKHNVSNYSFYSQADAKINEKLNLSIGGRYEYFNFDGEVTFCPFN